MFASSFDVRFAGTVDVDRIFGRLAFAPVVIEVGDSGEFGEHFFVEYLARSVAGRLLREDGAGGVAENFGGPPLAAFGESPVNRSLAFDDGARPERVAGDAVVGVFRTDSDGEASHAHLRDHIGDAARIGRGGDRG